MYFKFNMVCILQYFFLLVNSDEIKSPSSLLHSIMTPVFKSLLILSFYLLFFVLIWHDWYIAIFRQKVYLQTMFYNICNTPVWGDRFPQFSVVFYITSFQTGTYIQFLWYLLLCVFVLFFPCAELLWGVW